MTPISHASLLRLAPVEPRALLQGLFPIHWAWVVASFYVEDHCPVCSVYICLLAAHTYLAALEAGALSGLGDAADPGLVEVAGLGAETETYEPQSIHNK